jgi:hypothetical protein
MMTGAGPALSKCFGKAVGVDGGRGDDHLQVGPARQDLAQVAQQEVDVQAALVRLVDDERVVGRSSGSVCVSASRMPSVISLTEAPRLSRS